MILWEEHRICAVCFDDAYACDCHIAKNYHSAKLPAFWPCRPNGRSFRVHTGGGRRASTVCRRAAKFSDGAPVIRHAACCRTRGGQRCCIDATSSRVCSVLASQPLPHVWINLQLDKHACMLLTTHNRKFKWADLRSGDPLQLFDDGSSRLTPTSKTVK